MQTTTRFILAALPLFAFACSGSDDGLANDADARRGMALTVASVSPAGGTSLGGTVVTISGEGFVESTDHGVVFGDAIATDVTFVDETTLTATTPPGASGDADVTVFSGEGFGTLGGAYEYFPGPTISLVTPEFVAPGATITITGTGFAGNGASEPTIAVGSGNCASVNVVNDTEATCIPAANSGAAFEALAVKLSNENGEASFDSVRTGGQGLFIVTRQGTLAFFNPEEANPAVRIVSTDMPSGMHSIASAGNGIFFVRDRNNSSLVRLDLNTNNVTLVGALTENLTDLTIAAGQLIGSRRRIGGQDPNRFVLISQADATLTPRPVLDLTMNSNMLSVAAIGGGNLLFGGTANTPVYEVNIISGAVIERLSAAQNPRGLRSLTSHNGKIFGIRRGDFLPPPPGGGGGQGAALVEVDPLLGTITDLAALPVDSHGITSSN